MSRATGYGSNLTGLVLVTVMAYVDETGDTGSPTLKGSSGCFALGCILLDLDKWPEAHDRMVEFRRQIRSTYGIPMRQEIKANYLIRNNGGLRPINLSPAKRQEVYREHLRLLRDLPAEAFAVVTDKEKMNVTGKACLEVTWEMLLQRFERQCTYENTTIMISHDNGENDAVRRHVRKARRHLTAGRMEGGGGFTFKAGRIIDDPVPRDSQQSHFVQLADLVAYAGWRTYIPPSSGVAQVVPQSMWDEIGPATRTVVNRRALNSSVPGVVLRTR